MNIINDIGERNLLELFRKLVDQGELPFNDDAVAFDLGNNNVLVVNIDTLVESTDVPKGMSPYQIGAKTTTMAISDLAAKGVQPLFTVASGSFPSTSKTNDVYNLVKGIRDVSHEMGAKYLGGDTNEAKEIILSVVSIGVTNKTQLIKRSTAQEGDIVCTTGKFGLTALGFKVLLEGFFATEEQHKAFYNAIFEPKARVKQGLFLRNFGKITSCIDSSDGLAISLRELIKEKNAFGIVIYSLPIDESVIAFSNEHNLRAEDLALFGGEEFELIFTVNKKYLKPLIEKAEKHKIDIYQIGEVIGNHPGKIHLRKGNTEVEVIVKGWEHFKKLR